MRRQLGCLAVQKTFTGHEIQHLPTFFTVLCSIFSDIPCLDQSMICTAVPCVLRFVSVVATLLCRLASESEESILSPFTPFDSRIGLTGDE
jgi:hypothetical protein